MISESERREVAERLRMCARETNGTYDFTMYLSHWVGFDGVTDDEGKHFTIAADRREAELTLERLADLIDPVCHNQHPRASDGCFCCSECLFLYETTDWSACRNSFLYCPRCGARVVDDG